MNKTDWTKTKEIMDRLFEFFPDDAGLCDGNWFPYAEWKRTPRITFRFDTDFEDVYFGFWIEVENNESSFDEENNVSQEHTDKTTYSFTDLDSAFIKLKELLGGE